VPISRPPPILNKPPPPSILNKPPPKRVNINVNTSDAKAEEKPANTLKFGMKY
jgi:hypothetical protein